MQQTSMFPTQGGPDQARHADPARRDGGHLPPRTGQAAPPGFRAIPVPPPAAERPPYVSRDARSEASWTPQYEPQPELTPLQRAMPSLRHQIVNRLHELNWDHAKTAWERRRRDPIGPHAVLLFYAEPDDARRYALRVGCRNFFGTDEPRLAHLLHQLCDVTGGHIRHGNDLRTHVVNWCDEMTDHAVYLGVGVSSLDTPDLSWKQIQRDAYSDMDVPGRCYVTLWDATRTVIDRRSVKDFGDLTITTTKPFDDMSANLRRHWRFEADLVANAAADRATRDTWQQLDRLHDLILRGYSAP